MSRTVLLTVALLAAAALGAVLHSAFTGAVPDAPALPREESRPRTDAAPAPVVNDLPDRIDAMSRRLKEIEEQLRLLRQENADQLAKRAAAQEVLLARLWERVAAVAHAVVPEWQDESPRAVEEIRTRWREVLTNIDRELAKMLGEGADPNEVVMWSRLDDVKKARTELEAAADMKALRLLSKQHKYYFQFEVEGR